MRKIFTFFIILIFILCQIAGCGSYTPRNADLVVTYNGKIEHVAKKEDNFWTSEEKLRKNITLPGKKYIIFSANWCKACKLLKKAVKQAELSQNLMFLNLDEEWVASLAGYYRIKSIPTMFELDSDTKITNIRRGPGQIIVFLLSTAP